MEPAFKATVFRVSRSQAGWVEGQVVGREAAQVQLPGWVPGKREGSRWGHYLLVLQASGQVGHFSHVSPKAPGSVH